MLNERFEAAAAFVLEREGGLVDDPEDPGGITNHGISLRFLKGIAPYATAESVRDLTEAAARKIYREHFWDACRCSALPLGLDLAVFDGAVNQGPRTARRLLQRALGVKDDGYLGPVTLTALLKCDPVPVRADFLARRAKRYAVNPNVERYGRGWFRRLFEVEQAAATASQAALDNFPPAY